MTNNLLFTVELTQQFLGGFLICFVLCLTIVSVMGLHVAAKLINRPPQPFQIQLLSPAELQKAREEAFPNIYKKEENNKHVFRHRGMQFMVEEDVWRLLNAMQNQNVELSDLLIIINHEGKQHIPEYKNDYQEDVETALEDFAEFNVAKRRPLTEQIILSKIQTVLKNIERDMKACDENQKYELSAHLKKLKDICTETYNELLLVTKEKN